MPEDEIIGKKMADIMPVGLVEQTLHFIRQALDSGMLQIFEYQLPVPLPDGEMRHFESRIVRSGEDEILSIVRDITQRKKTEQALQESETRYRAVVEDQTELICRFSSGGLLTFVNDAYCRYFETTRENLIGKTFLPLLIKEDQGLVMEKVSNMNFQSPIESHEQRIIAPDGSTRWQQWTNHAILDENGSIIEYQAVGRDITEQKNAEIALRESEEKFRAISSTAIDGILLMDHEGKILYLNHAAEEMFGYTMNEVFGRDLHTLFAPERYHDRFQEGFHQFRRTGRGPTIGTTLEFVAVNKNGTEFPIEVSTSALSEKGNWHAVGIVRDITQRKRAEEQLNASLREKDVLLKEIHHRVKNNLQVISGLLLLQSRDISDEPTVRMLKDCQNRIKAMAQIHEKLYRTGDLARINFAEYIGEVSLVLAQSYGIDPQSITLNIHADEILLDVSSAIPCGLIINELLSNALKHAFPGEKRGTIDIHLREGRGGEVRLVVKDDGVGFPDTIDYRQTSTLGMQLVNTLTEQLGGTLTFERDGGTTFSVAFHPAELSETG